MTNRVYNFSAGPSQLPLPVLEKAAKDMTSYNSSGMSVMEMSHRSKVYEEIIFGARDLLREILSVPANYKILFLQGGASLQFAMAPMNLCDEKKKVDFILTGLWAKRAFAEMQKLGEAVEIASSADKTFCYIPETKPSDFSKDASYVHICLNNTIYGTKFPSIPDTNGKDIVCDMSSCILSEPVDVSKYAMIFAGAQKNMGPAGLTVAIIRDDLIGKAPANIPTMLDYKTHADNDSMYNTPPTYPIYIAKLILEWLRDLGGLSEMEKINKEKASLLYSYLDESKLFSATVKDPFRSIMNIPFVTGNKEIDASFVKEAEAKGFVNLKGHRTVGGMRASIYNAMPIEGVKSLVSFMKDFETKNK